MIRHIGRKCLNTKCAINIQKCLEFISVGKFSTILYLNRKNGKSSVCGGVTTLIWGVIVFLFTFYTLSAIFREETVYLASSSKTLSYYELHNQS